MVATCPECRQHYRIALEQSGLTARCSQCSATFVLKVDPDGDERGGDTPTDKDPENGSVSDLDTLLVHAPADAPSAEGSGELTDDSAGGGWRAGETVLGLYRVIELVGRGGMGTVHRVRHQGWNLDLAVKSPRQKAMTDEHRRSLFIREAEAWVGLGLHPNVASCFYVRDVAGIPRIFIEYIGDGSLRRWMDRGRVWDLAQVLDLAVQICDGMLHAHRQGLIHRDLKPSNCLMTEGGNLKITDFGLVRWTTEKAEDLVDALSGAPVPRGGLSLTTADGISGTPEYMSPEQWGRQEGEPEIAPVSFASDIYSFGVLLFEMLCRRRPFDAGYADMSLLRRRHREMSPPRPSSIRSEIPSDLEDLVLKALEKDPARRFRTFEELRPCLTGIYRELTGREYPRTAPSAARLFAAALNNRGVSAHDLGRAEEALSALREAQAADPSHLETNYNNSVLLWRTGVLTDEEVISRLEELRASDPVSWQTNHLLGQVHLERRDAVAAEGALATATAAEHAPAEVWVAKGDALVGQGKYPGAIEAYQEALRRKGEVGDIRRRAVTALFLAGEKQKAEKFWARPSGRRSGRGPITAQADWR